MKNFGSYFIDSNSTDTPTEIADLMHNVKGQVNKFYGPKLANKFTIMQNKKRFQFKNTECGMFCMYFLVQFLKKHSFEHIIEEDVHDDAVHKFRSIYYTST